jgi:lipopolysaccharide/colanic/teichoic acid biosynthesis glycosyltransferase
VAASTGAATAPESRPAEQERSRAGHAHAVHPLTAGLAGPRRFLNVIVAIVLLVLTAPLWIAIALVIKLTSRGPVLYHQTRVGLDSRRSGIRPNDPRRREDIGGKPFVIFKFRTMRVDAEQATGAVWASTDDPRITPVGRWLRQYRLDELPQLINVLRGDMNLVGPRPERPTIVTELRKEIPHYQQRHRALPGITGHAQVNLEYDSSLDDVKKKVAHDLEYIRKASAWEDFKIMLKTVPVMLFRRGSR